MRGSPRRAVLLTAVSVALLLPAVFSDLLNDDYFLGSPLIENQTLFNAYEFVSPQNPAMVPWWAVEGFEIRFFRPLSSVTLRLDFALFGDTPLWAHLHSLLWFLVFLVGGFRLQGRLLEGRSLTWAMTVLALSIFPAWAAGWIAARHAIMGGAFAVWAALFYLRWRQGGRRWEGAASLALFALGLFSSESALGLAVFVVTYELVMTREGLKERALATVPTIAAAVVYLIAYKTLGYGPSESGAYVDPLGEPLEYLTSALPKALALIGAFTFGVPAMLRMIPGLEMIPVIAGSAGLALMLVALLLSRAGQAPGEMRLLGWLSLMVLLSMAPALSGLVEGRGVLLSGVGFSAIAGVIMAGLLGQRDRPWPRRLPALAVALVLGLGLVVLAPLSRLGASAFISMSSSGQVAMGQESSIDCQQGARVYVVNSDPFHAICGPYLMTRARGRFFESWSQLVIANGELTLERVAPDRVRLSREPSLFDASLRLFREDFTALGPGTVVEQPELTARVVAAGPSGPRSIDFTIPGLETPGEVCLLTVNAGRLETVPLPELGRSTQVVFTPPQMGPR